MNLDQNSESGAPMNKFKRLNWDVLILVSLVVFSFAGLFFAGYVIWAKCSQ